VFADLLPDTDIFRSDLVRAGIPYIDENGCRADFHALRYTFCTMFQAADVSERCAMDLMRHSDRRLTNSVYTDSKLLPLDEAILKLPNIGGPVTQIDTQEFVPGSSAPSQPVTTANLEPCRCVGNETAWRGSPHLTRNVSGKCSKSVEHQLQVPAPLGCLELLCVRNQNALCGQGGSRHNSLRSAFGTYSVSSLTSVPRSERGWLWLFGGKSIFHEKALESERLRSDESHLRAVSLSSLSLVNVRFFDRSAGAAPTQWGSWLHGGGRVTTGFQEARRNRNCSQ
jgi:hypothetical protein